MDFCDFIFLLFGFGLFFSCAEGCNQLLDQNGATMTSPNYPKDYPNLSKCTYTIQAPVDKMIQLTFHTFHLEDHTECSFDSLKVYAGLSPSVDNLQQTLCGHRESFVVRNSGNEMLLVFKSDATVGRTGFRADVIFLPRSILAPTDDAFTTQANGIDYEYGNFATTPLTVPDCYIYVNSDEQISSPNYPDNYGNNVLCLYRVEAPVGHVITVDFLQFAVWYDRSCRYDSLKVYDGDQLVDTLCGFSKPRQIRTTGTSLKMIFRSDSTYSRSGFLANVAIIPDSGKNKENGNYTTTPRREPDCYIYVNSDEQISSPNYPDDYGNNVLCLYRVEAPVGHVILVDFFDFAVQMGCSFDFLKVYDGDQLVDTLCGSSKPRQIRTTGTSLKMKFISNSYWSERGFLANVRIIPDSDCDIYVNSSDEQISSPNYPDNYENDVLCLYRVEAPVGHVITVDFLRFAVQYDPSCRYDSLRVYDGDQLVDTLCGSSKPRQIRTTGTSLKMIFRSDYHYSTSGFLANVTIIPDSGIFIVIVVAIFQLFIV